MNAIGYLLIIMLNVANCRFKRLAYNKYDGHDLLCIFISIVFVCAILL